MTIGRIWQVKEFNWYFYVLEHSHSALPSKLGFMFEFNMIDSSENKLSDLFSPELCRGGKLQCILFLNNELIGKFLGSYEECNNMSSSRVLGFRDN